jgi:glycosyltransferase involved in cell wall biosynthesis
MRILLVHNRHRSGAPSGDDRVFMNEISLLESKGHHVIIYERNNDEFDQMFLARKLMMVLKVSWSPISHREIKQIIRSEKPDVVHFHNTFPFIFPSAYYACADEGVPVVHTLHDFRLLCPSAFLLRDGNICEECLKSRVWKAIKYGGFKK